MGKQYVMLGPIGTVRELIEKLSELDPETQLYMSGDDYGNGASLTSADYTFSIESR